MSQSNSTKTDGHKEAAKAWRSRLNCAAHPCFVASMFIDLLHDDFPDEECKNLKRRQFLNALAFTYHCYICTHAQSLQAAQGNFRLAMPGLASADLLGNVDAGIKLQFEYNTTSLR